MKTAVIADVKPRAASASALSQRLGMSLDLPVGRTASPVDERVSSARQDIADNIGRIIIIGTFTLMAVRMGLNYLETGRFTGLLLLLGEALVVALTLIRRPALAVDRSLRARLLTTVALLGPPLVRPTALTPLVPDAVTVAISAVGLLVVLAGKMSLGRSFGLIPANRGIVSSGLYRIVRHPIYLGYLITHVAFLISNPLAWNISLLVTTDIALLLRAVCEEKTLALDAEYRAYQSRVRWRVLPGLF
jgi:protein-S-isoprenylcysteine O-methyltransferase Ste14